MKILIYGAGVLGSVLAVKLKNAGLDVSILARGERYTFIKENGIVLQDFWTNNRITTNISVVDELDDEDYYDLIIVIMPRNNISQILPILSKNKNSPNILFIGNNVSGFDEYTNSLDKERILLGFWLGSGDRTDQVVYYSDSDDKGNKVKMYIGVYSGMLSERVNNIKKIIESAGVPVDISENIDAWLKTHAMLISPMALGFYKHNENTNELINSNNTLKLMSKSIKEGLKALHRLNIPILPKNLNIIRFLPVFLLTKKYKSMLKSKYFEIAMSHAKAGKGEMKYLSNECNKLIKKSKVNSPAFDALLND
ncbi:MAG: ketopantoate reductase family protein [Spirochaetota bacterium]